VQRNHRLAAALLLGVVVMTSCSSEGEGPRSGVGVRSINTNVGLGIELEAAAPANTVVQSPRRRRLPDEPQSTIPPFDFEIPQPSNRPCPEAGPFDFPDVEAGVEPQGRPAAGSYPWKLDGEVTTGAGVFPVDTFETRLINRVEDHPSIPDAFTFDVTQENLVDERQNRGTLTTRYRVVPRPAVQQEQVPNDAGKGLFIEGIVFRGEDSEGRQVETEFAPSPAIQLTAFPVKDGTAVDSTGTDPSTLASLTIRGMVKGHKQIDACGDRVDTWFTDAEQIFRYTDNRTGQTETLVSNYDYGVATQYGGLIVFEHVDAPRDEPAVKIEARVGRVPTRGGG
jgi:hypothetical protein